MVYEWKDGSRLSADPQKVGMELEEMQDYKDADSVLKYAKNKNRELHKCFEWDDTIAAEEHRKNQARLVLRMLVNVIEVENEGEIITVKARAYESVRFTAADDNPEKNMTYVPLQEALSDSILKGQILGRLQGVISDAKATAKIYGFIETSEALEVAYNTLV